jgi:hypothetical protein
MTATSQFKTTNQDTAAFITHRTGRTPELKRSGYGELVTITFPSTPDVLQAAVEFAAGCPESNLLGIRNRLFRMIREVKP